MLSARTNRSGAYHGEGNMVEVYKPKVEDLWFREKLLSDGETMSYNAAWGGTIPFPEERWGKMVFRLGGGAGKPAVLPLSL